MSSNEAIVTIPPEVVLMRASSTVFEKASSLLNLDLRGIVCRPEASEKEPEQILELV